MNYSPSPQEAAQELLTREAASQSLLRFTEYTNHRYRAAGHHAQIANALERVERGECKRLVLLVPPRHGKSELASRRFPAYALGKRPERQIISASATATLAEDFGRDVRNLISSQEYRNLFGTRLAEDSQAKGKWNTSEGGGYYAVGIGGALMGRGADILIIDDPFASMADAESELIRKGVLDWYTGTAYNRLMPGGAVIVINHRMHEEDLVGHLLKQEGEKWEVVNLAIGPECQPIWPEWYPQDALERIRAVTPARQWSALFRQDPTPQEGTFFQRKWFRRFRKGTEPKELHYYASSDHAPAGTEDGDYNCFRMWGVDKAGDLYLIDGFRHQETMDKSVDRILPMLERYKPMAWFPEDDNNWKAVAGFVTKMMRERSIHCRIEPISPRGADKAVKAQPFQAMASMGRVWLPEGPEGDDVLDQYLRFPAGKHDDEVDTAGTIGRALDMAHPAIVKAQEPKKPRDRWNNAFDNDDSDDFNWKVA